MNKLGEHVALTPMESGASSPSLHEQWSAAYGPLVAQQLHPDSRYALIRVGTIEFAYSDFDRYLRALGQAWGAGFVPESLPSALGAELLEAAPSLRGVDLDITDLSSRDVAARERRFS